jgi:hypothetical protein
MSKLDFIILIVVAGSFLVGVIWRLYQGNQQSDARTDQK